MTLDFASMALLTAINLAVIGMALPLVMGTRVSHAAQHAQSYFLFQAIAWGLILAASRLRTTPFDPALSLAAACAASTAQWKLSQALQSWLGPRPLRYGLIGLCILGPVGFALLIHSVPLRMAWYSLCHAMVMAILGWMCLHPQRPTASTWRYLMTGCAAVMSMSLLTRAYMASNTMWLQDFAHNNLINHVFVAVAQVCGSLSLVSMLVAWRDETNQKLRHMAMTDQLTGLANRHALLQTASMMQATAKRQQLPLAVVLLDLDHFKAVNDEYGHTKGDQALQLFAQVLQQQLRAEEMAARWGGEEFCLLMYAQAPAVEIFFQRLNTALRQQSQATLGFALHISAGCALQSRNQSLLLENLLQQADNALYTAKSNGRGKLVFEGPPPSPVHTTASTASNTQAQSLV